MTTRPRRLFRVIGSELIQVPLVNSGAIGAFFSLSMLLVVVISLPPVSRDMPALRVPNGPTPFAYPVATTAMPITNSNPAAIMFCRCINVYLLVLINHLQTSPRARGTEKGCLVAPTARNMIARGKCEAQRSTSPLVQYPIL